MKNVHLLPTDNPSRLIGNEKGIILSNDTISKYLHLIQAKYYNIYITSSDEKIKDCYYLVANSVQHTSKANPSIWNNKPEKIILTTDPKLISDGVQAIDDTFIEWFVKNPSCESVEVEIILLGKVEGTTMSVSKYKIIIPSEDPKQETLEEAAERLWFDSISQLTSKNSFIQGAKWQQEQEKNKYSEEEVLDILFKHTEDMFKGTRLTLTEWFEQFKKTL